MQQMAKFKSFRILYSNTLFNQSICDSCKKNGKTDEKKEPQANLSSHIFVSSCEWNIWISFSISITFDFITKKILSVCDIRKLKKPVEKSAPHPNAYFNEKKMKRKGKKTKKYKCEMWEENGSEQESVRKKWGMKSDSFFFK